MRQKKKKEEEEEEEQQQQDIDYWDNSGWDGRWQARR
jgi:hypothetical protein